MTLVSAEPIFQFNATRSVNYLFYSGRLLLLGVRPF
jgi:hypothetical protein